MNKYEKVTGLETGDAAPRLLTPEFDAAEYMSDLEGLDITEAQKVEFLETLWNIMGTFARTGFAVDVCGLILEEFNEASARADGDGNLVPSTNMESASEPNGGSA